MKLALTEASRARRLRDRLAALRREESRASLQTSGYLELLGRDAALLERAIEAALGRLERYASQARLLEREDRDYCD